MSPPDAVRYDPAIIGGRVLDPACRLDQQATLAIADGRIAAVTEPHTNVTAAQTIDATGLLVVPGLIDLHTAIYRRDASRLAQRQSRTRIDRHLPTARTCR